MENTIDLSKLIEILKRKWKLLITIPILFMIIALLVTLFLMKPQYQANTQVLVNQKEKNRDLIAQEVQSNIQLVNTYKEIIKSPRILEEVAQKEKGISAQDIANNLNIEAQAESQILNISFNDKNKKRSERIANKIAYTFSKEMPNIMNIDNVSILSSANNTSKKISPKLTQNVVIAFILGVILTLIIVISKELLDKRIKSEEDVENELGVPVLGSIPKLK
ncbi:Wzz/FepE/Etk N-terminal domain-containing protein [Staphylococcus hominis]|uniref:Wzz/FepE/Etk N-terminal domain-containing protein n=1 Tax=Staphylococcus hominis TaxID=1290 RepID=UPI00336AA7E6